MITWLRIQYTAHLLGLRDRGMVETFLNKDGLVRNQVTCPYCYTRARIGIKIDDDGTVVKRMQWCWRCMAVFDDPPNKDET